MEKVCVALILGVFVVAIMAVEVDAGAYDTSAVAELSGMRQEDAGLTAGGTYGSDRASLIFSIGWEIGLISPTVWHYKYVLEGYATPRINFFVLDLTDDCVALLVQSECVRNAQFGAGSMAFGTFGPGPSSPGFPAGTSITGVKFDGLLRSAPLVVEFDSDRPPEYGDGYVKGGTVSYVYNDGLADPLSADPQDFIARPGNAPVPTPEPFSLLLFASGLLLLLGYRCWTSQSRPL